VMIKQILVWSLFCLIVSGGLLVDAQTPERIGESPMVTKAVAPSAYPPIAVSANDHGRVVIEVKINSDGAVVKTKVIQGHPLLASTAGNAAKRWRFAAVSNGSPDRSVLLTFDFQIAASKEEPQVTFNPPYEVMYAAYPNFVNVVTPSKKSGQSITLPNRVKAQANGSITAEFAEDLAEVTEEKPLRTSGKTSASFAVKSFWRSNSTHMLSALPTEGSLRTRQIFESR
jgi:TonB family protein